MSVTTIEALEFGKCLGRGTHNVLIDVRTPGEYQSVHVESAINIPLNELSKAKLKDVLSEVPSELYVICQSGGRSKQAAEKLAAEGLTVVNVLGGTNACVGAGLPVVRGKGVISIELQVRIAAGLLVLVGALLGTFVHPWFFGLCAFIGAGLTFAGVTDWCGMAYFLAAMPWNGGRAACNK